VSMKDSNSRIQMPKVNVVVARVSVFSCSEDNKNLPF